MKNLILLLLFFIPVLSFSQTDNCIYVDSVYSTAKFKDLGKRDIRFGVKQLTEDILSEKFCIKPGSSKVNVNIFFFGLPKTTLRIVGVEKTNQITQVGVKLIVDEKVYEGYGESDTEIRTIMLEVVEGSIPFSKMTLSNAIKKAIESCASQIP